MKSLLILFALIALSNATSFQVFNYNVSVTLGKELFNSQNGTFELTLQYEKTQDSFNLTTQPQLIERGKNYTFDLYLLRPIELIQGVTFSWYERMNIPRPGGDIYLKDVTLYPFYNTTPNFHLKHAVTYCPVYKTRNGIRSHERYKLFVCNLKHDV